MSGAPLQRRRFVAGAGLAMAAPGLVLAQTKPRVVMRTAHGAIVIEIEAAKAPLTSANFLRYVDAKAYDGGTFFRAARNPHQPREGTLVGAPADGVRPYPPIAHESTTKTGLKHLDGTVSLGRFEPGTATNNFFICVGVQSYLDADPRAKGDNLGYAAFGRVVEGMPVVRKILSLPTDGDTKFADQKGQWLKPPVVISGMRRA